MDEIRSGRIRENGWLHVDGWAGGEWWITEDGGSTSATGEIPGASAVNSVMGFASIPGLGIDTTTGGKGGKVVTASTFDELVGYTDSNDPLIILVSGTIDLGGMAPLRSNKTIIGRKSARLINGGFAIYKRQNIIIRNRVFADAFPERGGRFASRFAFPFAVGCALLSQSSPAVGMAGE